MPTVTYTVAQVEAVRLRKASLPDGKHDVLRTFLNMKLNHMERPHAWTMAEAVEHSKYTIKNNLVVTHQRHSNRLNRFSVTSYASLMTRKRALYDFGVGARECFKDQDDGTLVQMLNDNPDIRDMAGSSDWCEIINDSDKFPDAPTYEVCSDCEYIESEDDGSWVYNGDRWVCSSCRENSYRWSDYHDSVVHEDDEEPDYEDDEEQEEESRFIGGYHSSKRKLGLIPTEFSKRETKIYMGLELEMEVGDGCDREAKAEELFEAIGVTPEGHNYCFLEDDGSLSHGFEMVTGYTGLDVHAKQLEFFKHRWADVKSHDTKTCGLHVHICKKGMSMFHAAKLILFMHDSRNQRLFRTIARRDGNRYSQVKNKTADYAWLKHGKRNGMQRLNEDRYESVNFQPERTIEFRLFKGTLRYETIMSCLEFTYMAWFFSRDTGQQDLTTDNFLKFISQPDNRKDTINLRSFLRSKGFMLDKSAIVKANPRFEKKEQLAEV